jgi:hypothetical protein
MRAGGVVPIAGADAASGARRKTRGTRGSARRPIVEFSKPAANAQAKHYGHHRETSGKVRSEGGRQHDLPTR